MKGHDAGARALAHTPHARKVPYFGVPTGHGARTTQKRARQIHCLAPPRVREGARPTIEELQVTKSGARRAELPNIRDVGAHWSLGQRLQPLADVSIPEVMLGPRPLQGQGLGEILDELKTFETLMAKTMFSSAPPCKHFLTNDPVTEACPISEPCQRKRSWVGRVPGQVLRGVSGLAWSLRLTTTIARVGRDNSRSP